MRPPHQWPGRYRLIAGVAGIDWCRATISRTSEHLRLAQQPEITGPVLGELRVISSRLAQLRRDVERAALIAAEHDDDV